MQICIAYLHELVEEVLHRAVNGRALACRASLFRGQDTPGNGTHSCSPTPDIRYLQAMAGSYSGVGNLRSLAGAEWREWWRAKGMTQRGDARRRGREREEHHPAADADFTKATFCVYWTWWTLRFCDPAVILEPPAASWSAWAFLYLHYVRSTE